MIVLSCEEDDKNDITVLNRCNWGLQVAITQSQGTPEAWVSIARDKGHIFRSLESGRYYLHVKSDDINAPPKARESMHRVEMQINYYDSWPIIWSDSDGYRVNYTTLAN